MRHQELRSTLAYHSMIKIAEAGTLRFSARSETEESCRQLSLLHPVRHFVLSTAACTSEEPHSLECNFEHLGMPGSIPNQNRSREQSVALAQRDGGWGWRWNAPHYFPESSCHSSCRRRRERDGDLVCRCPNVTHSQPILKSNV